MSDMLTGKPAYRPEGDMARAVAREMIYQHVQRHMARGNLQVSLGDLDENGVCPISITAEDEVFDLSTMLDRPTITGTVWIEDRASQPIHIWYAFPAQEHTPAESNYADTPPVAFWLRYGREPEAH